MSAALGVPVRRPKQEASLTVLLHVTHYAGRGDRLCTVRATACSTIAEGLRQGNASTQKQRIPVNRKARLSPAGGPFSKETSTASCLLKHTQETPENILSQLPPLWASRPPPNRSPGTREETLRTVCLGWEVSLLLPAPPKREK